MLLDEIDKYISEANLNDRIWRGVTSSGIDVDYYAQLNEQDRKHVFNSLDSKTKEQILKLQQGGLL